LTKIRIATFNCRPQGGNPTQRFRSPDGEQNRKIFLNIFNSTPTKFFQLRKRKFFCFAFLLTQELRKRFPTPNWAGGQKFLVGMTLRPLSFLFACAKTASAGKSVQFLILFFLKNFGIIIVI
jgi:hypothetical protein